MALAMARPWKHPKTGIYWFRKRVPDRLRTVLGKSEEKFTLHTRDPIEAKRLHASATLEVDQRWSNLNQPSASLSDREAYELAVPIYDAFLETFRDNPSDQNLWSIDLGANLFERSSRLTETSFVDFVAGDRNWLRKTEMAQYCEAEAEKVIRRMGLKLTADGRQKLVVAAAAALQQAAIRLTTSQTEYFRLGDRASGSPSPSTNSEAVATFDDLFDGWAQEAKPTEKTQYMWQRVIHDLSTFVGHDDPSRLASEDILRWKDHLLSSGLENRTVRYSKLAPVAAVFRWAADNKKVRSNPVEKIRLSTKVDPAKRKRGFTDQEASTILAAASREHTEYLRWIPWISAYTGARVSEVAQLRVEDVVQVDRIWAIRFVPEAGHLKNAGSERVVPVHARLEAEGFLEFSRAAKSGPLFKSLSPDRFGSRGGNGSKVVGRWVRKLGLTDTRLSPSHSWRHRLKTLARRHGLASDVVDAITGHSSGRVADAYGEFEIAALARELGKLP